MSEVIDLLGRQHQEVLARIEELENRGDPHTAVAFIDYLATEVLEHFGIEEEVLFPELAKIEAFACGPLRVMDAEHAEFRQLLAAARAAHADHRPNVLRDRAADLAALLRSHIAKEDGVLLPLALERLTAEQLVRIDGSRGLR